MSSLDGSETEVQRMLARDLEYLPTPTYDHLRDLVTEVKKMLGAFHRHRHHAAHHEGGG